MKKNSLWLIAIAMLFSSCSQRLVDFTVISSKNVPITENGTDFKKADTRVKGTDSKWTILMVPGIPNMKEAIDRAIEQYPGAVALTDGVIYSKNWTCLLFGQNKYVVEGTPLYPNNGVEPSKTPLVTTGVNNNSNVSNVMRFTHVVNKNETLLQIATAYKVTVADIMKWNSLTSSVVTEGTSLIIFVNK